MMYGSMGDKAKRKQKVAKALKKIGAKRVKAKLADSAKSKSKGKPSKKSRSYKKAGM